MNALQKRLKQLEARVGIVDFKEVIFKINGQDSEGEEIPIIASVNNIEMSLEEFNHKYPNFKPSDLDIKLGDWDS